MPKRPLFGCADCGLCLGQIELFQHLSADEEARFLARTKERRVMPGDILFQPGDRADHILILRSGELKLSTFEMDGRERIEAIVLAGEIIGEECAVQGDVYQTRAEVLRPSAICLLPIAEIRGVMQENPDFAFSIVRSIAQKLADAREMVRLVSIQDAKERVLQFLEMQAQRFSGDIDWSQQMIASAINLSRETVSKKLTELAEEGRILQSGYKKIRLVEDGRCAPTLSRL